jgi:sugar O-acyltransferase (sialic acid O-acetyltransferase NeuD family)
MDRIHLLGCSSYTVAVIADVLKEVKSDSSFVLYPNLKDSDPPITPQKMQKFEMMPLGSAPDPTEKVFFATAGPKNKLDIYTHYFENHSIPHEQYLKVVHPSAYIAPSSLIENGVLIEPGAVISSQSKIEFGVFIKRGSLIGHHNTIGVYSDINPGVVISGAVTIGAFCSIGSGSVIKNGIRIGDNTIIGVGSVVTKDIPSNCIAFGNPCKVVRENNLNEN